MSDFFYLPENLFYLNNSIEKTDDDSELQIYSYKSCTNDSSDELKAYRGLVFDKDILIASSLGFTPEYNENELDKIPDLNLTDYSFFPAEEGTLLRVFFHKKWYLSTHRKLDAFQSRWGSNESFGDIFLKCIGQTFENLTSLLNQFNVYFFLVRNTKETRIVSHPPEMPKVYHVGTLVDNEVFDMSIDIGIPRQQEMTFESMNDVSNYVFNCDPLKVQGLIAFSKDGKGKQLKIVNTKYQYYSRIRDNEPDLNFRFLQLWRDKTSLLYQKFMELYPQFDNKTELYTNYSFKIAKYLHNMYFKKFVKKEKVICQKEEWSILQNVHTWFWAERTTRKVTFDVMYKMVLSDENLRAFYRIMRRI